MNINTNNKRKRKKGLEDLKTNQSPFDLSGDVTLCTITQKLGQTKIGNLCIQMIIQQNIGRFNIPVYDRRVGKLVQIRQASC